MDKIPKIAHFYWGAESLPFLRYITLISFCKMNPSWEIRYYTPSCLSNNKDWLTYENTTPITGLDYSEKLLQDKSIQHHVVDFQKSFSISNSLSEVKKSDFLRLYLLSTVGGLWSDMDIIYFRPLEYAFLKSDHETYVCCQPLEPNNIPFHSIGLLLSCPFNPYFQFLFKQAGLRLYQNDYQSIGSPYYQSIPIDDRSVFNFSRDVVYAVSWMEEAWKRPYTDFIDRLDHAIGLHWYAGFVDSGVFQNLITDLNYKEYPNIYCYLIKQVLEKID